jgi:hypothetical protein
VERGRWGREEPRRRLPKVRRVSSHEQNGRDRPNDRNSAAAHPIECDWRAQPASRHRLTAPSAAISGYAVLMR